MRSSLALLLLVPSLALGAERMVERIAAIVNDEVIALSEVYDIGSEFIAERCPRRGRSCVAGAEREVLDALVRRALQRQELQELGYDVSQAEIDAAIQQVVRDYGFPDREALRAEVERSGLDWELYREQQVAEPLREQRFAEAVLRGRIAISEDEMRDQYQRLIRDVEAPPVVEVDAIGFLVPADADADVLTGTVTELRAALRAVAEGDQSWDDLAERFDTAGVRSLFAGQSFTGEDLNDKLAAVIFPVEAGGVTEPVLVNGVLYAFRVVEKGFGDAEVAAFEDVEQQLMEQVFQSKLERAAEEWYEVAKRRAAIRYLVGAPDPAPEVGADGQDDATDAEDDAPPTDAAPADEPPTDAAPADEPPADEAPSEAP